MDITSNIIKSLDKRINKLQYDKGTYSFPVDVLHDREGLVSELSDLFNSELIKAYAKGIDNKKV